MEVGRVIDANLNRLKEGIRVIEDTLRYFHNDVLLSSSLKNISDIKLKFLQIYLYFLVVM